MKIVSVPPRLILCATPWSLEGHPTPAREWSLDRKLSAIQGAGFDGVCAYITPELKAGAERRGLRLLSGFDCGDLAAARTRLLAQRALGVHFINIQLLDHDTPPARAAAMAVRLIKLSRRLGLGVHIEVHRDTATETPGEIHRDRSALPAGHGRDHARDVGTIRTSPSPSTSCPRIIPRGCSPGPSRSSIRRFSTSGLSTVSIARCP